jgi:hypothetical protein
LPARRSGALRRRTPALPDGDIPGPTSRQLLLRSAAAGGALAAGGGILALRPGLAVSAPSPSEEVRVLNFVLLLERVQAALYREASTHVTLGADLVEYAKTVGAHEQEHVAVLEKALGTKARNRAAMHFGSATRARQEFLTAAIELEELSVAAYNGQAPNLSPKALGLAAEIVSVEARHAAWIRAIAGKLPAPGPIDQPRSSRAIIAALARTGFVKGLHP